MDFTFNKFCVRILKGMSKGSRACVNFEGKIRTQNLLKVKSELYTTENITHLFFVCPNFRENFNLRLNNIETEILNHSATDRI